MAILDFSVSGWHGFGSITQVCFGISVSNFMCMSFVAVGSSLTIVSYVAFKMAALWFWTMFYCNPPIAHCHPLLCGRNILVDHWSTISSYIWVGLISGTFQIKFKFHTIKHDANKVFMIKNKLYKDVILPTEYCFSLQLIFFLSLVLQFIF